MHATPRHFKRPWSRDAKDNPHRGCHLLPSNPLQVVDRAAGVRDQRGSCAVGGKVIQVCRVGSVKTYRNVTTRQRSAFYFTSLQSQPPSCPMRPLPHFSHQALLPAVTPMAGFEIRDESEYADEADVWSRCMAVR